MDKTGQILNVVPTQAGGYHSQNGWIYTFNMTIQFPDGATTGEIGAKTEQYPLAAGEQISVQITNSQNGVKFKKFNPQYAPQPQPQGGQQAPQRPAQATNAPATSKDRLIVTQVVFKAMAAAGGVNEQLLEANVNMIMRVGSGQKPESFEQKYNIQPDPVNDNAPLPTDDDASF